MMLLRHIVGRVGIPGLLTWLFLIGIYLLVRVPDRSWLWSDLAKYTAMVVLFSYVIGKKPEPFVLCTNCGKKNTDPKVSDLSGWQCGYCHKETLMRVERPS
jgi:DNA-directed RNA polymerase subunit RPC12/RpoP